MKSGILLAACLGCVWAQAPSAPATAAPVRAPGLYVTFHTTMGNITARLFEKEAPLTVRNFRGLALGFKPWKDPKTGQMIKRPLYTGVTFHRVIPGFMIQAGDPTGTGMHNCGFTIPDEIVPTLKFDVPGRLAMANVGSPHTGACQFFITEVPYPSLNGGYTIFGQVVEGQDLVAQIARVPRDANDRPRTPVRISSLTFKRVGPAVSPASGAHTKKP